MTVYLTRIALILLLIGGNYTATAQQDSDLKLANHYFQKGEFDKAEVYYKKLVTQYNSENIFERYFMCLFYQEKFTDCEVVVTKWIKRDPISIEHKFKLASIYEVTDRPSQAESVYKTLVEELPAIQTRIDELGKKFKFLGRYDYAIETYAKGKKLMKDNYGFQLELAELYSLANRPQEMISEYMHLLEYSPVYLKTIETYLSRAIDFESDAEIVDMLRSEILLRVQADPDAEHYNELFIWFYLHNKEYNGAVIQAKAFDRRKNLLGKRTFEVGQVCNTNQAWIPAKAAFAFVEEFGESSPYYHMAVQYKLGIEFIEVTQKASFTQGELELVAEHFESALTKLGRSRATIGIQTQLARIYAFYLNQPESAEAIVSEAMKLPITRGQLAELKILLGDVFIVSDKIWEASLLYMQVEKEFSEDVIGHEAKFKNAKVFYYDGEFDYAKAQLDVLKASTSKLIANDAMQLSLLLQDNLGIDTTLAPVQMYANADLLLQQNRYTDALKTLDSLEAMYPFHSITDEVLFKKAEIFEQLQNWDKALELYSVVVESYGHDILADDAAFRIAKIYDYKISDKEKAAEYYKKILFDFPGSLYNAEARERYREIKAGV